MTDTKPDTESTEDTKPEDQDAPETPEGAEGEPSADDPEEPGESPEVAKLRRKADRRERELRKAQEELAALRKKVDPDSGEPEPSAEERANQKLIRASARTVLAAAGVTDKADQAVLLGNGAEPALLSLAGVSVDENGDPDEGEIQDRVDRLREIFGAAPPKPARRTPKVTTTDRGGPQGGDTGLTEDQKRMRRILRGGR